MSDYTVSELLAALDQKKRDATGLLPWLYPSGDKELVMDDWPYGHKLFEGVDKVYARDNYQKHLSFFKAGKDHTQRLFCAANRCGKTVAGALEVVYHVTGNYPEWWEGHRFATASDWWVAGKTSDTVRDILQPLFLGKVGEFGNGLIPKGLIDFEVLKAAKKDTTSVGIIRVKHVSQGWSTIAFKSYEQGRGSFEGTAKSIYLDEEPPLSVYTECLTRTATGGNILFMTFTPLQGVSDVIKSWFDDGDVYREGDIGSGRYIARAGWDDIPHLSAAVKEALLASYPPHEREARSKGIPSIGSGAIYPVPEASFVVEPFAIPKHWQKSYGYDVGRNTAGIWTARDPDSGMLYTYAEFFMEGGTVGQHVEEIMARGKWIKGAIDTAARGRSPTDGENLYKMYEDRGLHITNADKAVAAGIYEVWELLVSGRLKVFNTCTGLIKEIRGYQRNERGEIIKKDDHRVDAWRYGIFTRDKIMRSELEANQSTVVPSFDVQSPRSDDSWMLG